MLPPAIFIMGATATGKTDLAIALTKILPCELISVDSALIYQGMNIGTAKPKFFHHLIDICDPAQSYSAVNFRNDALAKMAQITKQGKIPVLVGGTFLYFKTLLNNVADLPNADLDLRAKLKTQMQANGVHFLHQQLQQIDAQTAAKLHQNDSQRIMRALEVFYLTSKPLSAHFKEQQASTLPYQIVQFGLTCERQILRHKIAMRFAQMLTQGFVAEVEGLYKRGDLAQDMPSMRAVGYRQLWQYLAGEISFKDACERAVIATCQLAKRQDTWLKSWQNVILIDNSSVNLAQNLTFLVANLPKNAHIACL